MNTLLFIAASFLAVAYAHVPCHDELCDHRENGALFRISDDHPGQFVQCSNNIAYCFDCPANLMFSNKKRVCVFPKDLKKPIIPFRCNDKLCNHKEHGALFQFPHRPTRFVQCSHGKAVCKKCPKGLVFLNSISVCAFPVKH